MVTMTLVQPPNTILSEPNMYFPLSLLFLGAVLEKAGHRVQIADLRTAKRINVKKQVPKAEYVGITATTGEINDAKEIARQVKRHYGKDVVTLVGGAHPSLMQEDCVSHFDCIVVGEGERAILEIVGKGARRIVQCEPIKDLDTIPFPARHLVGEKAFSRTLFPGSKYGIGERATTIISARGCPFNCAFCANIPQPVRFRSPQNIAEEVREIKEKYDCRYLRFEDDNFTLNKKRLLEVCEALKPLKIFYKCHTRSQLLDEEMCKALKESGCEEMGLGVEVADDEVLRLVNKNETVEDHERAIKLIKEAGIRAKAYFMIGLPGSGKNTIRKNMAFVAETQIDKWTVSIFCCYPGCEIWRNPEKFGVKIIEGDYGHYWNFNYPVHELENMNREQIYEQYQQFYSWLRSEEWRKK